MTTPQKSGREAINLGSFIKINNFIKKMDDLSQKTIMLTKKYHLKLSKQTFVVITQKSLRIAFNLEIFIKSINFMNKMND